MRVQDGLDIERSHVDAFVDPISMDNPGDVEARDYSVDRCHRGKSFRKRCAGFKG